MSSNGTSSAYLVMAMVREGGSLVIESETICFDRDLAISMATEDGAHCSWVGVYALDADGRSVQDGAVYSVGSLDRRPSRGPAFPGRRFPAPAPSAP